MKSDLLADLRADVEAAAREEQAAIDAAKAAKAAEEARQAAAAEAAREAEVAERLEAEARRQALLVEARAALEAPAAAAVEPDPAPAPVIAAPVEPAVEPMDIAAPAAGLPAWVAVAGLAMVCVTAVVVAVIWSGASEPTTAPTLATPPPPVLQVVDSPEVPGEGMVLPAAYVPEAAPATKAAAQPEPKTINKRGKRGRTIGKRPPKTPQAAPKTLGWGSDILSGD